MSDYILFKKTGNDKLQCLLCPNLCVLAEGQFGLCKTRKCENEEVINPYSGIISSSGLDPIEKKPLYHFYPGSEIFSVGFYGCTLKCQFCQNYSISQYHPEVKQNKLTPKEILYFLKEKNLNSIAFTYSEPTLYFEWVLETAKLCRKNSINTVLVTNGYLNQEPAEILLEYISAANIDLKSGKERFYNEVCAGKLEPVKNFIRLANKKKVHVELTTLVITDTNDSISEMEEIRDFISSISEDIPFHISRYHPDYNFNKPATSTDRIDELVKTAKEKLHFVYAGNMTGNSNTFCRKCNALLIKRDYYTTEIKGLNGEGICTKCGVNNNFIL